MDALPLAVWCLRLRQTQLTVDWSLAIAEAEHLEAVTATMRNLGESERRARAATEQAFTLLGIDPSEFGCSSVDDVALEALRNKCERMAVAVDKYHGWTRREQLRERLLSAGLDDLEGRIRGGKLDGEAAAIEFSYARAETLWNIARAENKTLDELVHLDRHDLVKRFMASERQHFRDNVSRILAGHLAQLPQGAIGEMRVILGEIAKKSRHIALRKLFSTAGNAIQRIKPILLMSPISVAQFLPPGNISFDLLVIDEASQVRPEDALGAIARSSQIVVVGDRKQLPPSSFFDRVVRDNDGDVDADDNAETNLLGGAAKVTENESILTLCEARGLPSRMLNWHYRSRDPSLIQVSNREFYDSKLISPPSPSVGDRGRGLIFNRVDGAYDRGGSRTNRLEGDALVDRISGHARSHPTPTLGVVTFSFAQRDLIAELLDQRRRRDTDLDRFMRDEQLESIFVKNLENVQGDERDVIFVSVGYGPSTVGGKLTSMAFGPVNAEGGERRLNVLFTRARVRCEVFASFDPEDIDETRATGIGPRILKRFLHFAKTGQIDERRATGLEPDSPFEEDVAAVIRDFGFLADPQVGTDGFRIDIGVRHHEKPGAYILAVECDGATYHSALWARERDRLRQDILENMGWRFYRIWSTDWFYRRTAEIERLRLALVEALEKSRSNPVETSNSPLAPHVIEAVADETSLVPVTAAAVRLIPRYERFSSPGTYRGEPHEALPAVLIALVTRIVETEGPIHVEEIARRLAACFGKERAGARILATARKSLRDAMKANSQLQTDQVFYFTSAQSEDAPVRDRSEETGTIVKAEYISEMELKAAMKIVRDDNAGGVDDEIVRATARLLGFKRVGADLHARIALVL